MRKTSLLSVFLLSHVFSCSSTQEDPMRKADLFGRTTLKLFVLDEEKGPVAFGVAELLGALNGPEAVVERGGTYSALLPMDAIVVGTAAAAAAAGAPVEQPPREPGAFRIATTRLAGRRTVHVVGADHAGTMYGCMELAARFLQSLDRPLMERVVDGAKTPFLARRAFSTRIALPLPGEGDWWFLDESYWQSLLDQMARNRFNALELRGVLHVPSGTVVSAFPYFVAVPTYEHRGVPPVEVARNQEMLQRICAIAADRGIEVGVVNDRSVIALPDRQKEEPALSHDTVTDYTRKAVKELLERVPALAGLGFACGEPDLPRGFHKGAYVQGIQDAGRQVPVLVVAGAGAADEMAALGAALPRRLTVEVELNGGHLGVPWPSLSRHASTPEKAALADLAGGPRPYALAWRVSSADHTLTLAADPEFVRRCVRELRGSGGAGLDLEAPDSHGTPVATGGGLRWRHERYWPFTLVWGRLGFDPDVPRDELVLPFRDRFGSEAGPRVQQAVATASLLVPAIVRNRRSSSASPAPEFATGGTVAEASHSVPLDRLVQMGPREFAIAAALSAPSGRTTPFQAATDLLLLADLAEKSFEEAKPAVNRSPEEFARLAAEARCLASLARHHARMLRAGTEFALYEMTSDRVRLAACRSEVGLAIDAWRTLSLAGEQTYPTLLAPRGLRSAQRPEFQWKDLLPQVERELEWVTGMEARHEALFGSAKPARHLDPDRILVAGRVPTPELRLEVRPVDDLTREVTIVPVFTTHTDGMTVQLWHRALSSRSGFARTELRREDRYRLTLPVDNAGAAFALEVLRADGGGALSPDPAIRAPYSLVPPRSGPVTAAAPASFATEGAAASYSCALLGDAALDDTGWQRLLAEVAEGLHLVVFRSQPADRDPVARLPGSIKRAAADIDTIRFAPGHPLLAGLPPTWSSPLLATHELSSGDPEWARLSEPCCLALRKLGKGSILVVEARLLELAGHPVAERLLRNILVPGSAKPVLVLDTGSLPSVLDTLGVGTRADWR